MVHPDPAVPSNVALYPLQLGGDDHGGEVVVRLVGGDVPLHRNLSGLGEFVRASDDWSSSGGGRSEPTIKPKINKYSRCVRINLFAK